jgi:hypothetical protein
MSVITIAHGSPSVVEKPTLGLGKPRNDYGPGFYTTRSIELAKEWACPEPGVDGYANEYTLNLSGLTVYTITSESYNILNWLALLLNNRDFRISNDVAGSAKAYLLAEFLPKVDDADILIGYRADDSYFAYANSFLNSVLSLQQLESAMYLGNLGEQTVLISEKAFARIRFQTSHIAQASLYYVKRMSRDKEARQVYREQRSLQQAIDAVYVLDIIRGGWKNDDARLSGNLSQGGLNGEER